MEGRPPREQELIARARRGDARAYERLIEEHQSIAYRTAYVITGSSSDAEEAAQDALLKAFRALDRFRPGAPFRPWLLRNVANEARNRRRAGARQLLLATRAAGEPARRDAAPSPEAALLAAERREALLAAVNALDERDRVVIACRLFLELDEEETAATLACRRGTVKSRLSRALARLRTTLEAADA